MLLMFGWQIQVEFLWTCSHDTSSCFFIIWCQQLQRETSSFLLWDADLGCVSHKSGVETSHHPFFLVVIDVIEFWDHDLNKKTRMGRAGQNSLGKWDFFFSWTSFFPSGGSHEGVRAYRRPRKRGRRDDVSRHLFGGFCVAAGAGFLEMWTGWWQLNFFFLEFSPRKLEGKMNQFWRGSICFEGVGSTNGIAWNQPGWNTPKSPNGQREGQNKNKWIKPIRWGVS